MNLSNNKMNLIQLKVENKILRQKIDTAKNFISSINYLYSDILLHKEKRIVIDQKTFDLYKLNIEFELQYNVPALKRNGIEVNSLPPIHKKKTWTYSNSLDQAEIYNSVAKEIEYLCSL